MRDRTLLIFSYDFPPNDGGIARLCAEIARGMHPYYRYITVLTHKKKSLEAFSFDDKVSIIEVDAPRGKLELQFFKILSSWKNKDQTDVICGVYHPEATLAWLTGFTNMYILGHGTEFIAGHSWFRKKIKLPCYAQWILKQSKAVIANSHYTPQN